MRRPSYASEKAWQKQVTDLLDQYGYRWHHETDSRKSPSGLPDLIAAKGDLLLAVELKTDDPASKTTPAQRAWLEALQRVERVYAGVWRPSYLDAIPAILAGHLPPRRAA